MSTQNSNDPVRDPSEVTPAGDSDWVASVPPQPAEPMQEGPAEEPDQYPRRSGGSRWRWILPAGAGLVVGALALGLPLGLGWTSEQSRVSDLVGEVADLEADVASAEERMSDAIREANGLSTDLKSYEQREQGLEDRKAELDEREAALDDRENEISQEEERVAQRTFGDGVHVVGTDIEPGTYRRDDSGDSCYWARLSDGGGGFGDILANDNVRGPATVVIAASDWGFESSRCGKWTKVD